MFIRKKNSLYTISLLGLLLCIVAISRTQEVEADITQTPDFTFGTTVDAALQISIRDGVSLYGHRTIFTGSGVDFGRVTFTNPELIGNGDAYVDNNKLYVEAILDIGIIFSGLLSVHVDLSKLMGAPNGFKNVFTPYPKIAQYLPLKSYQSPELIY